MYHLIDELKGDVKSRMVIETFETFADLKEYLVQNTVVLYSHIPGIRSYPNYVKCRSFNAIKEELEKNSYMDWGMTAVKTEDMRRRKRRVFDNLDHSRRITIKPLVTIRGARWLDNGVSCKFGEKLDSHQKKVLLYANQYRVLHKTDKAVLIEWVGEKGSSTTWVPNTYIK